MVENLRISFQRTNFIQGRIIMNQHKTLFPVHSFLDTSEKNWLPKLLGWGALHRAVSEVHEEKIHKLLEKKHKFDPDAWGNTPAHLVVLCFEGEATWPFDPFVIKSQNQDGYTPHDLFTMKQKNPKQFAFLADLYLNQAPSEGWDEESQARAA